MKKWIAKHKAYFPPEQSVAIFFPWQLIKTSQAQCDTNKKKKRTIFAVLDFSCRMGFRQHLHLHSSNQKFGLLQKPLCFFAMLRSKRIGNRFDEI